MHSSAWHALPYRCRRAGALGLSSTLSNPALALTVFVPSDAAFRAMAARLKVPLAAASAAGLQLSAAQKGVMRSVMYYHMVSGSGAAKATYHTSQLKAGMALDSLYLSPLTKQSYQLSIASVTGGPAAPQIQIKSIGTSAYIYKPNIKCGAGVAHGIDNVLVPMNMALVQAMI